MVNLCGGNACGNWECLLSLHPACERRGSLRSPNVGAEKTEKLFFEINFVKLENVSTFAVPNETGSCFEF